MCGRWLDNRQFSSNVKCQAVPWNSLGLGVGDGATLHGAGVLRAEVLGAEVLGATLGLVSWGLHWGWCLGGYTGAGVLGATLHGAGVLGATLGLRSA